MLAVEYHPVADPVTIQKRKSVDGTSVDPQDAPKKPKTPERSGIASSSTTLTPDIKAVALSTPRPLSDPSHRRTLFPTTFHPQCLLQSGIVEKVHACKQVLDKLHEGTLPHATSTLLTPQRISLSCATGSYFCRDMNGKLELVVKVGMQESGGAYCPNTKQQGNDGILPGESLIREVFAYLVQKKLNLDFGIPATCLTTMKHRLFGDLKGLDQAIENLEKFGLKYTYSDLYTISEQCKCVDHFLQLTLYSQRIALENALKEKLASPVAAEVVSFCQSLKLASMSQFSSSLKSRFSEIDGARPTITKYWNFLTREDAAQKELSKLFHAFKTVDNKEALVSAQSFELNDTSFDQLTDAEAKKIRASEFSKFVIDVMLFNYDRPRTNVLVKKVGDDYKLILIDHGFVLPRPFSGEDYMAIRNPIYGFHKFEQAAQTLTREFSEKIASLDIESLFAELKDDLLIYETLFPGKVLSAIPDECFTLLECNIMWLKKAVSRNLTLRQIADFHLSSGDEDEMIDSPLITCLKQARVGSSHKVDPVLFEKAINDYLQPAVE